jgi:hypothetical protein
MSEPVLEVKPSPAPIKPEVNRPVTRPGPGVQLPTKTPRPASMPMDTAVKIHKQSRRGAIADIKALLASSDAPDALKAALAAELDASGAKAAALDLHRHEVQGESGRVIIIHATVVPLF